MITDPGQPRVRRIWALTVMFSVAAAVLTADAISKAQVLGRLTGHQPVRLLHGLVTLDLTFNAGAAFGVGPSYTVVIALIVCGVIVSIIRTARRLRSLAWIVLDEPTTAMDVETRRLFWSSMKAEVAQGRTLLFATHYLEEADQAADRILVINRGRLLADGTPAEIKARAGARRISFRLDRVDEPFLLGLPGLVNLEVRHDVVQIQSSDSDATLYAILDAGYRPHEIEVSSLGLEQAFLAITAEDDAANGNAHAGEAS